MVLVIGAYALSRVVPAMITETALGDFVQAYKWLLYSLAFCVAVGRNWGPTAGLFRTFRVLLGLALIKALLTVAIFGGAVRSGLLTENNFEIALFVGMVMALYGHMTGRERLITVVSVGLLTLLSGSRSGIIALVILAVYVVVQAHRMNLFGRYVLTLLIVAVGWFAAALFVDRVETGGVIDRLVFLDVFLQETSDWTPIQWVFGSVPLTPLSTAGCGQLSYYQYLFSSAGDGSCYSVILHAFTMRVIFDAGLLGFALALGAVVYGLKRSQVASSTVLALIAVALSNGLSVSGLNNAYVALPILVAILASRPHKSRVIPPAKTVALGLQFHRR
jgi:hypothetical protein